MDRFAGDAVKNTENGAQAALASQAAIQSEIPAKTIGKKKNKMWENPFGEDGYDGPIEDYNFYRRGGKYFDAKDRRRLEALEYTDTQINDYVKALQGRFVTGGQKLASGAHLPEISELDGFDPYQFGNNKYQTTRKGKQALQNSAMDFMLNYDGQYGDHAFDAQQISDWTDENNFKWSKKARNKMKAAIRDYVPKQDPAPEPEPEPEPEVPDPPPVVEPPAPVAPPAHVVSGDPIAGDPGSPLTQAEWNTRYVTQPDVENQEDVVVNSPSQNFGTARTAYRAGNDAMDGFEGLRYSNIWNRANPTQNWSPTTRKLQAQENVYQMQAEADYAKNRIFGDLDNYKPPLFTAFPVNTKKVKRPNLTPPASVTTPQTFTGL